METMLGISLYSYPYLKLAKPLYLSYHCLCLLFNKIGKEDRTGSSWKQGGGGRVKGHGVRGRNCPNNVCTMNKLINFKNYALDNKNNKKYIRRNIIGTLKYITSVNIYLLYSCYDRP
jgi:hypothetical protein